MRISDWSSDVCSSDLPGVGRDGVRHGWCRGDEVEPELAFEALRDDLQVEEPEETGPEAETQSDGGLGFVLQGGVGELELGERLAQVGVRTEERTSEFQSLTRTTYAVFCSTKQKDNETLILKQHQLV